MKPIMSLLKKAKLRYIYVVFAAALIFLCGRVSLLYELNSIRAPIKVVTDSNVQIPSFEIIHKPPGPLRGWANHKEARIMYEKVDFEVDENGIFEIP